ncbi:MAG TPA: hypothetical protein VGB14_20145 [Acidimicrobiales bacterium]
MTSDALVSAGQPIPELDPVTHFIDAEIGRLRHDSAKRTLLAQTVGIAQRNAPRPAPGWGSWMVDTAEEHDWPYWVPDGFAHYYIPETNSGVRIPALVWSGFRQLLRDDPDTVERGSRWNEHYFSALVSGDLHRLLHAVQNTITLTLRSNPYSSDRARLAVIAHVLRSFGWPVLDKTASLLQREAMLIPA